MDSQYKLHFADLVVMQSLYKVKNRKVFSLTTLLNVRNALSFMIPNRGIAKLHREDGHLSQYVHKLPNPLFEPLYN